MLDLDILNNLDLDFTDTSGPYYAHYAKASKVTEGYIMGIPVIALCGVTFVPSRDPEKLEVCSVCKELIKALFLNVE